MARTRSCWHSRSTQSIQGEALPHVHEALRPDTARSSLRGSTQPIK